MARFRVLLGLSNTSQALALKVMLMGKPDIEIVGEAVDALDILLKIANTHATVVVIGLPSSGKDSGLCSHILAEYPDVRVFAISKEGDHLVSYEMAILRKEASDTSLENMVDLICQPVSYMDNGWVRLPGVVA